ncbi:hypothetical protein EDD37DRAFT_141348 [Exophiala viscosa]|uniref:uncharacterized protein n=1 Tax=Exophiala viscosa TaxID=2486360 RepID=UPI00219E353B|nr:hypothetical protein EDD37DRAFT_141348 [Exophiala viscosa]
MNAVTTRSSPALSTCYFTPLRNDQPYCYFGGPIFQMLSSPGWIRFEPKQPSNKTQYLMLLLSSLAPLLSIPTSDPPLNHYCAGQPCRFSYSRAIPGSFQSSDYHHIIPISSAVSSILRHTSLSLPAYHYFVHSFHPGKLWSVYPAYRLASCILMIPHIRPCFFSLPLYRTFSRPGASCRDLLSLSSLYLRPCDGLDSFTGLSEKVGLVSPPLRHRQQGGLLHEITVDLSTALL